MLALLADPYACFACLMLIILMLILIEMSSMILNCYDDWKLVHAYVTKNSIQNISFKNVLNDVV